MVNATSDFVLLTLNGNPGTATAADVLVTYMQFSSNFSRYVKTTSASVPLSWGANIAKPVSRPQSPFGYQDTSINGPPTCDATTRGLVFDNKTAGIDRYEQCQMTSASPVAYGWVPFFMLTPATENYLLQSDTWGVSPWSLLGGTTALPPVITAAPAVADPFGNTGTVQEVFFNLNSTAVLQDTSYATQTVTKPGSGITATTGIWVKAKTGTPLLFFGNGSAYNCVNIALRATSAWQYVTDQCTDGVSTDQLQLGISYIASPNPYPNTADVYVFGACMAYFGGNCTNQTGVPVITTTVPVTTPQSAAVGSLTTGSLVVAGSSPTTALNCVQNTGTGGQKFCMVGGQTGVGNAGWTLRNMTTGTDVLVISGSGGNRLQVAGNIDATGLAGSGNQCVQATASGELVGTGAACTTASTISISCSGATPHITGVTIVNGVITGASCGI